MAVSKIRKSSLTITESGWLNLNNEWTAPDNGMIVAIVQLTATATDNAYWTMREVGGDINLITCQIPPGTSMWAGGGAVPSSKGENIKHISNRVRQVSERNFTHSQSNQRKGQRRKRI